MSSIVKLSRCKLKQATRVHIGAGAWTAVVEVCSTGLSLCLESNENGIHTWCPVQMICTSTSKIKNNARYSRELLVGTAVVLM